MTTLYLDRRDLALKLEGRTLAIYADQHREGTVPLHLLERIVLRANVQLDSAMLARLADQGIALTAFGGRIGDKVALVHGRSHNDGARRVGQYRCCDDADWQQRWAHRLVLGKLKRQRRVLRQGLAERPDRHHPLTIGVGTFNSAIQRLHDEPALSVASLRGIEGAAAAAYFKAFCTLFPASLNFTGRNRRPPRDPVNAVLSLGYALLHAEAVRASYGAGLDPLIGYYHQLAFGRESPACDLIEPLRPSVDAWAWTQFREQHLRLEHFSQSGQGCLLDQAGRARFYAGFESAMGAPRRLLRRAALALAAHFHQLGRPLLADAD